MAGGRVDVHAGGGVGPEGIVECLAGVGIRGEDLEGPRGFLGDDPERQRGEPRWEVSTGDEIDGAGRRRFEGDPLAIGAVRVTSGGKGGRGGWGAWCWVVWAAVYAEWPGAN